MARGSTGFVRAADGGVKRGRKPILAPPPFCPVRAVAGLDLPPGVRLVLPYPPAGLNPNVRHAHPAKKAPIAKAYREECWAMALQAFGCGRDHAFIPASGPIAVRLDFYPPNTRARDDDNAEAAFKAGRDGVAAALRVDDARFVVTRALHRDPRGCVVMTFADAAGLGVA